MTATKIRSKKSPRPASRPAPRPALSTIRLSSHPTRSLYYLFEPRSTALPNPPLLTDPPLPPPSPTSGRPTDRRRCSRLRASHVRRSGSIWSLRSRSRLNSSPRSDMPVCGLTCSLALWMFWLDLQKTFVGTQASVPGASKLETLQTACFPVAASESIEGRLGIKQIRCEG